MVTGCQIGRAGHGHYLGSFLHGHQQAPILYSTHEVINYIHRSSGVEAVLSRGGWKGPLLTGGCANMQAEARYGGAEPSEISGKGLQSD